MRPPVVILDKPQLADNIGAVARVMANFGLDQLRLVSPRDGWPQDRAWATASGADWVLDGVQVFDSVAEAIADLNTVFSTTARPRETRLPVRTPREASRILYDDRASGLGVGLLDLGQAHHARAPVLIALAFAGLAQGMALAQRIGQIQKALALGRVPFLGQDGRGDEHGQGDAEKERTRHDACYRQCASACHDPAPDRRNGRPQAWG